MYLWKNKELWEISSSHDSISDLFQGKGVFETILVTKNATLFLWDRHIQRLKQGIQFLGKKVDINFVALHDALIDHFQSNPSKTLLRLNLTYLPQQDHLMVRFFPYDLPEKPAKLYLTDRYVRGNSPHYQYKTLSRMENIFFQNLAQDNKCDDFLIISHDFNVLETSLANIFFVRNDSTIETPTIHNMPLLNGVLRQFLIDTQQQLAIQCIEKTISIGNISIYNQAFITNGLRIVQPVSQIGQWQFLETDIGWSLRDSILDSI